MINKNIRLKVFFLGSLLIIATCRLFAQTTIGNPDQNKIYNYSVIRNMPDKMNNLYLGIDLANVDIYTPNFNFFIGVEGGYNFKNICALQVNFKRAYADRMDEIVVTDQLSNSEGKGSSVYKSLPFTSTELILQIFFNKQLLDVKEDIQVKSGYQKIYYISVPAKRYQLFAARLGYNPYFSYFSSTTKIGGDLLDIQGYKINQQTKNIESLIGGSMYKANVISLGISRKRFTDIFVKVEDFGEKSTETCTEFYGDILLAQSFKYQNMVVCPSPSDGVNGFYEYNIDENTAKSKLGIRIGVQRFILHKINWMYGLEVGARPGPGSMSTNTYLQVKMGICFSTKLL